MNHRVQKLASALSYFSGAAVRRWRRQAADAGGLTAVTCYHRVLPDTGRRGAGASVAEGIPASTFEAQMHFLLRHFEPVPASSLSELPPDGRLRFAVTFDDGYLDNHDIAAPILQRLGVPATFYVVSNHVGSGRRFWWDLLGEWLRSTGRQALDLAQVLPDHAVAGQPSRLVLEGGSSRQRAASRLENLRRGQ